MQVEVRRPAVSPIGQAGRHIVGGFLILLRKLLLDLDKLLLEQIVLTLGWGYGDHWLPVGRLWTFNYLHCRGLCHSIVTTLEGLGLCCNQVRS